MNANAAASMAWSAAIHHAEIRDINGVEHHNRGDWAESCTALAEDMNGKISVIRRVEIYHLNKRPKVTPLKRAAKEIGGGLR